MTLCKILMVSLVPLVPLVFGIIVIIRAPYAFGSLVTIKV